MVNLEHPWRMARTRDVKGHRSRVTAAGESQDRKAGRAIELFHFAFLEVALTRVKVADFVLKGGGNLRLFLGSKRRSRDLDLDFVGNAFSRFADRIDEVFRSSGLVTLLAVRHVEMGDARRSKDTDTVKRWKLSLKAPGTETAPTRIEFSARGTDAVPVVERCDETLARRLRVRPVVVNHYPPVHAIEQKVGALAGRSETQPRDVFDLDHLLRAFPDDFHRAQLDPAVVRKAIARAMGLTYPEYLELVVHYLEEEVVELYGSEEAWDEMQLSVVSRLEERLRALDVAS